MAIREDYLAVLRDELGAGYEAATLATCMKEYVARALKDKVLARRRALLDTSALVAAREAREKALQDEEAARRAAEAALLLRLDVDMGDF